ncbi:hypothetical protein BCR42DRAFT_485465 [Absidia repens]|uniref:SEC7 domain-containing protein n=1 Tax=Absidia repens TaxID=90262 RepID=A0A1X2J0C2_9FUNG|nr:hypothetical protein BCR42DRAFT_485465 [Absidia repens]
MSMAGSNSDTEKNDDSKTTSTFTSELHQFDFKDEAIDTALRKLLAKVILPKEAQQIDRAMEDFASHYHACNPTLTDSPDPIYAVAFSILLLHTDAHNKNVKRKMNKDTFIKRTKVIEGGESVYSEILDVMYDNIVSSEFTYAQDQQDKSSSWFSKKPSQPNSTLLHDLYPKLDQLMPPINTFGYKPTPRSAINIINIHQSIDKAPTIQLAGVRSRQQQTDGKEMYMARVCKAGVIERKYDLTHGGKRAPARGWRPFGMILSGSQIMFFGDMSTFQSWIHQQQESESPTSPTYPKQHIQHHSSYSSAPPSNVSTPTTVASLSTICSAQSYPVSSISDLPIISASSAVSTPLDSPRSSISTTTSILTSTSQTSSSSTLYLRPVQIISLSDCICLYDDAYQKYPYVFRLITGDGQQFLIRCDSAEDVDDWIQKINYMSTMKTTSVRLRPKSSATEDDATPNGSSHRQHNHQHSLSYQQQKLLHGTHYYQQNDSSSSHHWAKRESKAKSKVISLSEKLLEHKRSLEKDEQLRNQLMVLTPVQKATKDRMLLFAETIGKRLLDQRISLQRLECYREYIERELFFYQSLNATSGSGHGGHSNDLEGGGGRGGGRSGKNGRGKMSISRKLSAPLPFYSGLLQVRSAASSPKQQMESMTSTGHQLLRPPLLGMTMAPQDGNDDNAIDNTLAPSGMRIPHRSSSLLISLSGGDNKENGDDGDATENMTTGGDTVKSDHTKSSATETNRRSSCPYLDPIPKTEDLLQHGDNDGDDSGDRRTLPTLEGADNSSNNYSAKQTSYGSPSSYYQHHHPRVAEVDRISRQRSQSNPDSFVQLTGSNENKHEDGDHDDDRHPSSLQIPHIKKNRGRSVSEVTTDDEDFSIVVAHGEKDSLVNHVDRIVDAI